MYLLLPSLCVYELRLPCLEEGGQFLLVVLVLSCHPWFVLWMEFDPLLLFLPLLQILFYFSDSFANNDQQVPAYFRTCTWALSIHTKRSRNESIDPHTGDVNKQGSHSLLTNERNELKPFIPQSLPVGLFARQYDTDPAANTSNKQKKKRAGRQ